MTTRVIVDDGTTRVEVPASSTIDLRIDFGLHGSQTILRTLDGSAIKQAQWQKDRIQVSGRGRLPPGLDSIDFCKSLTLEVAEDNCTLVPYTVFCTPPTVDWNHSRQDVDWVMSCREVS